MSSRYDYNSDSLIVSCDACEREEVVAKGASDFRILVNWCANNGWKNLRDPSGVWHHTCPDCMKREETPLANKKILISMPQDLYSYLKTIARASGQTMTALVNQLLTQHKEQHQDIYDRAKGFVEGLEKEGRI